MNIPGFETQDGFLDFDPDLAGGVELVMTDPEVKVPRSKLEAMLREVTEAQYRELLGEGYIDVRLVVRKGSLVIQAGVSLWAVFQILEKYPKAREGAGLLYHDLRRVVRRLADALKAFAPTIGSVPQQSREVFGPIELLDQAIRLYESGQIDEERLRETIRLCVQRIGRSSSPQRLLVKLEEHAKQAYSELVAGMIATAAKAALEHTPVSYRDQLHRMVLKDLLGPAAGPDEEVDEQRVSDRYLVGMLAPRKQQDGIRAEELDDLALAGDDDDNGTPDAESSFSDTLFPSSFGMSFCVEDGVTELELRGSWGRYLRQKSETVETDKGNPKTVWKRYPVEGKVALKLKVGTLGPVTLTEDQPEVFVQGIARRTGGHWIVSLFLVNGQEEPTQRRDEAWLFQPVLEVRANDGAPAFVRRGLDRDWSNADPLTKKEMQAAEMLYRRHQEFAIGHGVSATWEEDPSDFNRARSIRTSVVPTYEVPRTDVPSASDNENLEGLVLDMKVLSELKDGEFKPRLSVLTTAYKLWIDTRHNEITQLDARHQDAAKIALDSCERALVRIQEGIDLLESDSQAADAFRFANKAMWYQRCHSIHALNVRRGQDSDLEAILDTPTSRSWRPFQIAFLLLNLPSLTNLQHDDRDTADLLWFPTGGGKTEAYLGVAAYTMALRRLQGVVAGRDGGAGMSVLMRYTLRLLTLQQFQRAGALLCAMEDLRRSAITTTGDTKWGKEPFRLGLWVGLKTTPNTTKQADEAIKLAKGNKGFQRGERTGSPLQITNCPWCGCKISESNIKPSLDQKKTVIYCGDDKGACLYTEKRSPGEGLPLIVVDEEIYRRLPTMLIATVDKFAQMPWNGAVQALFGQVEQWCPRHGYWGPSVEDTKTHPAQRGLPKVQSSVVAPLRPPDLIIQDELHLISGPLGSLVGLYETAVDQLSAWEVNGKLVRPKVIASTATIRRASDQIHSIFMRKCEIFPPSGLDVKDNFFSVQRDERDEEGTLTEPGRLYVGICAPGKRLKAALIRVYTAYLAAAQSLYAKHGSQIDPWMTLVGYFNSLRELGGMRRLVDDDVRTKLRDMDRRGLSSRKPPFVEELTSRMSSSEIPRILDRMEVGFDPIQDEARESARKANKKFEIPSPLDVLLSSNMISVGVDVQRLGLMVVAGQPKTTAEYIQATSRVGRGSPGLVCTVFNWARPRDLSHYEMFEHYHATFYRHVEALSVTPFASRALDRGLSAMLISLVRLGQFEMNENKKAQQLDRSRPYVTAAVHRISTRGQTVTGKSDVGRAVEQALKYRLDEWEARAKRRDAGSQLGYETEKDGVTIGLLKDAGLGPWDLYTCLNSLRDVEPSVSLILSDKELD